MSYEFILYETKNGVATITLNRPEKLNALTSGPRSVRRDIHTAMETADADREVRCVLLTGAGRAFSSGGDISSGGPPLEDFDGRTAFNNENYALHGRIRTMTKPVIAAINGICYGAGLVLASHCDILIASDQAKFSFIQSRFGGGGVFHFPLLIGVQWTKRLLFTGEIIGAQRAFEIGLVTEVLPHDVLMEKAQEFGERIAAMPPMGVRNNKLNVDGAADAMGLHMMGLYDRAIVSFNDKVVNQGTIPDGRTFGELRKEKVLLQVMREQSAFFDKPWP